VSFYIIYVAQIRFQVETYRHKIYGHTNRKWSFCNVCRCLRLKKSPFFAMNTHKTDRIETHSSLFGGKVLTDEKSHDFFNVPKLHPTHRWKRLLPISVSVPS
jgi:hypothetical protein